VLPGRLVTFGIDSMISLLELVGLDVADTAKTAERATAVLAFVALGTVAGALFFAVFAGRRARPGTAARLVTGALVGLPVVAISLTLGGARERPVVSVLWLGAVFLGWGAALAWGFRRTVPAAAAGAAGEASVERLDRRRFLVRLGAASAVVTVAGAGLARLLSSSEGGGGRTAGGAARPTHTGRGKPLPNLDDPVVPAPGTRPEYTPLEDHYSVYIRTEPSQVDGESWRLEVAGLVERPLRLSLDEFRGRYPARDQFVTISCISGRVGTGLGTTLWTGARLQEVLDDAGLAEGARWLHVRSADGYYETVDLELVRSEPRMLLCYDWDGRPLPAEHGFPLRIWIPDRYGMKQPKWIESIEVSDSYVPGYWVERGWDKVARVKATSVIDTVAVDAAHRDEGGLVVPVGGIAFAGVRGISKVEVRVNGGEWHQARLRAPLSETTWVIWRYDWPFDDGEHTLEVRCFEGDGTPQIADKQSNRPSGASGLHHKTVEV
jgi:DMSO/TMAO reductase YedYZ molybdopterin-dependent catalytic subunit